MRKHKSSFTVKEETNIVPVTKQLTILDYTKKKDMEMNDWIDSCRQNPPFGYSSIGYSLDDDMSFLLPPPDKPPTPPPEEKVMDETWMQDVPTISWGKIVKKDPQPEYEEETVASNKKKGRLVNLPKDKIEIKRYFKYHPLKDVIYKEERYRVWKHDILETLFHSWVVVYQEKKRVITVLYHHDREENTLSYGGSIWKRPERFTYDDRWDPVGHRETALFRFLRKPIDCEMNAANCKDVHATIRKYIYTYGVYSKTTAEDEEEDETGKVSS
jgi:hypothetical protein